MLNPAHILETAFLLLAAFLVGAIIGSLAKLLALRLQPATRTPAAAAQVHAGGATGEASPALVAAPVIEPVTRPAQPAAPADVPVPDFSEVTRAIGEFQPKDTILSEVRMPRMAPLPSIETGPPTEMAPAREAGKATSGKQVASPRVTPGTAAVGNDAAGPVADVIPFPIERSAPAVVEDPVVTTAHDAAVASDDPAEARPASEAPAGEFVVDAPSRSDAETGTEATPDLAAAAVAAEPEQARRDAVAEAPEPMPSVEPVPPVAEQVEPVQIVEPVVSAPEAAPTPVPEDEQAAMRAIEGTWTPRRAPTRRAGKVPMPEGVVVDDPKPSEAPVATEPPGKPEGIAAPRGGVKDNLTNVIGILPVIETSLNSVGVYHFDQIAAFDDDNVAWIEGHLGIAGRIDREHWREQARELAVISDRARKVAGKS